MRCPFCNEKDSFIKDSRENTEGDIVRRRRHCIKCGKRFTTFERVQLKELTVIKRSGAKKPFDRVKIENSIKTALRKRYVKNDVVEQIVDKVLYDIENSKQIEFSTRKIGDIIMHELANIDEVAYIRFASVYKDFTSVSDFANLISKMKQIKR